MGRILIQQYPNQLQDLRKVSGTHRKSVQTQAIVCPMRDVPH